MTREEAHRILDAVLDLNETGGRFKAMLEVNRYDYCNEQFASVFVFDSESEDYRIGEICTIHEDSGTIEDALKMIEKWRAENDAV